jgi:hypothetical protein
MGRTRSELSLKTLDLKADLAYYRLDFFRGVTPDVRKSSYSNACTNTEAAKRNA